MEMADGKIKNVRIALGGVAHKPWRATKSEDFLRGKEATEVNFEKAAAMEMADAEPLEHNAYKVELGTRAIVRALKKSAKI